MNNLPKWALTSALPSVHDFESATTIEMVAKLYSAMSTMIREFDDFVNQINDEISSFNGSSEKEISNFKESVECRIRCQFEAMDAAFAKMKVDTAKYADEKIEEIYEQYLGDYVSQAVSEKIASGEIDITLVYDPETESLTMTTEEV